MVKFKVKILITLILSYTAIGVVSWAVFYLLIPQYYFDFYPVIGIFYWVSGVILNYSLDRYCVKRPSKMLNAYMMIRLIKFLLTIAFLFVGVKFAKAPTAPFAISLMCNYFMYTALELYIYNAYNKQIARCYNEENSK